MTIHQLLTSWGQKQRQLPLQHDQLKNNLMSQLPPATPHLATASQPMPWLSLALTGVAVILFIATSPTFKTSRYKDTPTNGNTSRDSVLRPADEKSISTDLGLATGSSGFVGMPSIIDPSPYPFPIPSPDVPITDTREFIKTNYNATMRTREVETLIQRVQTTIRGFGGRVDSSSSSKERGYVTFAVPANSFEVFRTQIKDLVPNAFFSEQTYTQNLLPQKQSIEQQLAQIEKIISQLNLDKERLTAAHNQTVATFRAKQTAVAKELTAIRADQTTDPIKKEANRQREQELIKQQNNLNTRMVNENANYNSNLKSLDYQLQQAGVRKDDNKKQDQRVLDNVATVQGTISLTWISYPEIISLYLPDYWPSILLIIAAVVAYVVHYRRSQVIAI